MKKVWLFSILLTAGIAGSQLLPGLLGNYYDQTFHWLRLPTMIALAFIMIHVGYEFDIDKSRLGSYGWDYVVAMTAAAFPWLFACAYFVFVLFPPEFWGSWDAWKESLLASRFAAPTSAGVLFSMLVAAGLGGTWLYRKARVLAIFDDLDTVLLMIPLKMLMVGLAWQLGLVVALMFGLLWLAWRYLHRWKIPASWPWVLGYATAIGALSEAVYFASKMVDETVPVHIEVLLPAFVLGCVIARHKRPPIVHSPLPLGEGSGVRADRYGQSRSGLSTAADSRHRHVPDSTHDILESPVEQRVALAISAAFMVLVGLNMPFLFSDANGAAEAVTSLSAAQPMPGWGILALHVVLLTVLSNLGKMFPAFCYRSEAGRNERIGLAIGLWPRGEVGAGVLVASLGYGLGGPLITSAMLCLALNLVLTGVFIAVVRKLLKS